MPLEIIGLQQDKVTFVWEQDDKDVWPARALRLQCACAHCKSEITGEKILDEETVPEQITVTEMRLMGNYGVAIHFSDGHTTGIYRFSELRTKKN